MAVVYRHRRLDTNEIFYIGIGKTEKRAYAKKGRNTHWKRIVNKVDYTVEIIFDNLTWKEACELEKSLIWLYGRRDLETGTLVNMTNGGEGTLGTVTTKETRKKLSEAGKNRKPTPETRKKLSERQLGELSPRWKVPHTKDTKDKMSKSQTKFFVIDKLTKEVYSIKEACDKFNCDNSYLRKMLKGLRPNKTNLEYK